MSKKKYGWCSLLDKELPLFGIGCYYCKHQQMPVIGSGDLRVCVFQQYVNEANEQEEKQKLLKPEELPKPNPLVVLFRIAQKLKEIDAEFEIKADGIIIKSRKKEEQQ